MHTKNGMFCLPCMNFFKKNIFLFQPSSYNSSSSFKLLFLLFSGLPDELISYIIHVMCLQYAVNFKCYTRHFYKMLMVDSDPKSAIPFHMQLHPNGSFPGEGNTLFFSKGHMKRYAWRAADRQFGSERELHSCPDTSGPGAHFCP